MMRGANVPKIAKGRQSIHNTANMGLIGARIKSMRIQRNLTQVELSVKCGVTSRHLSEMENGKRTPILANFLAIGRGLGCSLDYLAGI